MDKKGFTIGLSMIILGICFFLEEYISRDLFDPLVFIIGSALFAIYISKGKIWALVPSIYILYYCLIKFLCFFGLDYSIMLVSTFLISPGIIFLCIYFTKNRIAYLSPGCFMICLGLLYLFINFTKVDFLILFVFFTSVFCISSYLLSKKRFTKNRLKIGVILNLITVIHLIFNRGYLTLFLGGFIVILVSVFDDKKGNK